MSREDAYGLVHRLAMISWEEQKDFRKLVENESTLMSKLTEEELDSIFDYGYYTRFIDDIFKRAGLM